MWETRSQQPSNFSFLHRFWNKLEAQVTSGEDISKQQITALRNACSSIYILVSLYDLKLPGRSAVSVWTRCLALVTSSGVEVRRAVYSQMVTRLMKQWWPVSDCRTLTLHWRTEGFIESCSSISASCTDCHIWNIFDVWILMFRNCKRNLPLKQAVEVHRGVRSRGYHIF
jgi:hypothetical protein